MQLRFSPAAFLLLTKERRSTCFKSPSSIQPVIHTISNSKLVKLEGETVLSIQTGHFVRIKKDLIVIIHNIV